MFGSVRDLLLKFRFNDQREQRDGLKTSLVALKEVSKAAALASITAESLSSLKEVKKVVLVLYLLTVKEKNKRMMSVVSFTRKVHACAHESMRHLNQIQISCFFQIQTTNAAFLCDSGSAGCCRHAFFDLIQPHFLLIFGKISQK